MSLISGPASTPPASAAGCLRTVAALLFLLQVPPAAAAASSGQLSEAQHPLPPSLSRTALAASRLGGARDSGSDRTEPGRRDSSGGQGTAPGRPTLYDERSNRLRPRRLASSASSGSSSSDPGSAGFDGCSEELLSCTQDRTCLSCVDGETVNVAECWEKYHPPEESDLGGGQLSFCQSLGGSYCCGAYEMYYSESAVVCVEDEAALAYWVRAGDPVFCYGTLSLVSSGTVCFLFNVCVRRTLSQLRKYFLGDPLTARKQRTTQERTKDVCFVDPGNHGARENSTTRPHGIRVVEACSTPRVLACGTRSLCLDIAHTRRFFLRGGVRDLNMRVC